MPFEWGFHLSEFDPYYQYYVTRHISENGLFSWYGWHVDQMWFPQGRDVALLSFPAFPMTGAVLYFITSFIGLNISVLDVCILFPVVFAALTCIVIFFLGKELGGNSGGLLSALFLAVNPAYIGRTGLGFNDDETVGVFGILLTSFFFLRSLKQNEKWYISVGYALAGGIGLGYVNASWGASRYLISLLALFTFLLLIGKKYSRRLLISYGTILTVGFSIAVLVPKMGLKYITEIESLAAIGIFLLLFLYEISQRIPEARRNVFIILSLSGLGISAIALSYFGLFSLPGLKFISVLNPFERITLPLVESVQEHRPATWSAFYWQFGSLVFLAPIGIIFALRRITAEKLFMITYALTTLYFAASMIRLTVLLAPALCILAAFSTVEILRPFIANTRQGVFTRRRRARLLPRIGKGYSILFIVTLFIVTIVPLGRGIDSGYSPTTIASSSLPVRAEIGDWLESLTWMRSNLEENAIVASWWDYGYWITVMGEQITLADNGTFNGTQIGWIGRMFMSTESEALTMITEFNQYAHRQYGEENHLSYVVVFTTLGLASEGPNLYGDEVKWRWMARIGINPNADEQLADFSITQALAQAWSEEIASRTDIPVEVRQQLLSWYEEFGRTVALPPSDTVLTKLMMYGTFNINAPESFQLIFSSSNDMVHVYKILY
jgi:dolichyl-diphosphooligosaccharide--protein glycosyltransferase